MRTWNHYKQAAKARNANERRRLINIRKEKEKNSLFYKIMKLFLAILKA